MSKYCKYPWTWLNIKLKQDKFRFCCRTNYLPSEFFLPVQKSVKYDFLNHELPTACNDCWKDEANSNGVSYRTTMWGECSHEKVQELDKNPKALEWIDIDFGDLCNMYCASCGPSNSTTWQQILKVPQDNTDKFQKTWVKLQEILADNIDTLGHINIYGGEPSIDKNFITLVDYLSTFDSKSRLQIYTNGNYSESYKVKFENGLQKLLHKGWQIDLHFSIDEVGENLEFIRGGINLDRFENNIKASIDYGFNTLVNISLSMYNIEHIYEPYKWFDSMGIADKITGKFNYVSRPKSIAIAMLGGKIKDFIQPTPENMPPSWNFYNQRVANAISKQVDTSVEPNKLLIEQFIITINNYSKVTKRPIPQYYLDFIERIKQI